MLFDAFRLANTASVGAGGRAVAGPYAELRSPYRSVLGRFGEGTRGRRQGEPAECGGADHRSQGEGGFTCSSFGLAGCEASRRFAALRAARPGGMHPAAVPGRTGSMRARACFRVLACSLGLVATAAAPAVAAVTRLVLHDGRISGMVAGASTRSVLEELARCLGGTFHLAGRRRRASRLRGARRRADHRGGGTCRSGAKRPASRGCAGRDGAGPASSPAATRWRPGPSSLRPPRRVPSGCWRTSTGRHALPIPPRRPPRSRRSRAAMTCSACGWPPSSGSPSWRPAWSRCWPAADGLWGAELAPRALALLAWFAGEDARVDRLLRRDGGSLARPCGSRVDGPVCAESRMAEQIAPSPFGHLCRRGRSDEVDEHVGEALGASTMG